MSFIEKKGLKISSILFDFVNKEIIPGTDIQTDKFWDGFEKTVHELAPINKLSLIHI